MAETSHQERERRALVLSKWGNLIMGLAGVLAALLSNSSAVLVDGLFSFVGFLAAVIGARVSANVQLAPDRRRPFGYAADESIYRMFRAMSLLGLVAFAVGSALVKIVNYALGGDIAPIRYEPLIVYFVFVGTVCFGLAFIHHRAWRRTGRVSPVLEMEAKAAAFDGIVTLAAGVGLGLLPLLEGGPLSRVAPIGDSLIVLLLCGMVVHRYFKDFMAGLGEVAGVSAAPATVASARRAVREALSDAGGKLVDLSVLKLGRTHHVQVYYDPEAPITADRVDELTRSLDGVLAEPLGPAVATVLVSRHGRVLGEAMAS